MDVRLGGRREDVPAIVLGTSVTALGALRALARRRIPTYVLTDPDDLVTRSRYYRPLPGVGTTAGLGTASAAALREIAARTTVERAVLLPCTDRWVEAAAELGAEISTRFPASLAPREAIETLLDKGKLASYLKALGLPHPRTAVVTDPRGLEGLDGWDFDRPFLKPRSSAAFMERYRVKALRVSGREEAFARLKELASSGTSVVIQEYVPGPADHHYFIDGFVDGGGRVRARFARRRLRMFPADFGNSTALVSVAMEEVAPAAAALDRLLSSLRYRGIFSAEFKKDSGDGVFKLLEVNTRPWWYVDFAESCGVGIVELAYRDALGLELRDAGRYPVGRRCVYPYFDFAAWKDSRKNGNHGSGPRPGFVGCAATWLTANQPVFAWDDPAPSLTNFWMLCKRSFRNKVLRIQS